MLPMLMEKCRNYKLLYEIKVRAALYVWADGVQYYVCVVGLVMLITTFTFWLIVYDVISVL